MNGISVLLNLCSERNRAIVDISDLHTRDDHREHGQTRFL